MISASSIRNRQSLLELEIIKTICKWGFLDCRKAYDTVCGHHGPCDAGGLAAHRGAAELKNTRENIVSNSLLYAKCYFLNCGGYGIYVSVCSGRDLYSCAAFFGFPDVTWFTDVKLALPFVMMIYIWQVSGFYIVIYLSGLQTISPDLTEAAKIDGADHIQIFFRITIPLLKPTLFFGMTYSIISAFQVFDQIVAVSQNKLGSPAGATSTMVTYFYANAFQYYDMGYGCAAAIVLFILIMLVSVAQKKLMNDGEGV